MLAHMSAEVQNLIGAAASTAASKLHSGIQSADLAQVLVASGSFGPLIDSVTAVELVRSLSALVGDEPVLFGLPISVYVYSDPVKRILAYALEEAQRRGEPQIRVPHLLIGVMTEKDCAATRLLRAHGIDFGAIRSRG